jgi:hypothetical protein
VWMRKERFESAMRSMASYMAVMRFVLVDEESRCFLPQRYCFRGAVDNWIGIGPSDGLESLVKTYFKHLGKDSMYDLY